jgi:hypothetical protein
MVSAQQAKAAEVRAGARADLSRKVSDIVRQSVAGYIDPRDAEAAAAILRVARRAGDTRSNAEDIRWTAASAPQGLDRSKAGPVDAGTTVQGEKVGQPAPEGNAAPGRTVTSKAISNAQAMLDADMQRLDAAHTLGEVPELREADEMIQKADALGRAFDVAASCVAGRA